MTGLPAGASFELLEKLGSGGCGEVHLARDRRTGQFVALKTALPDDEDSARGLAEEFARIAPLTHPGIVRAVDYVAAAEEGGPYIVFEVARGRSSEAACRDATPREVLCWAAGLAETLDYLHHNNLLHGDLKPVHVFIDEGGVPRLIDFGLARAPGEAGGGTPATSAPELLAGQPASTRSELYSLGATLFFWLTGRYPWGETAAERAAAAERRPALPRGVEGVPPGALRLLRDLLAPHPAERPRSAREVVESLAAIGVELPDPSFADLRTRAASLPLIGREAADEALDEWLAHRGERALFVALTGPPGAGRTRLLREAAGRARLSGRRVAHARPTGEPLPLSSRLPAAVRLAAEAGPLLLLIEMPPTPSTQAREMLAELPRRLDHVADLIVIAAGETPPGSDWTEFALQPLGREQVAALVRALLPGPAIAPHLASRLQRHTGGWPGRVLALLLEAVRRGAVLHEAGGWSLSRFEQSRLADFDQLTVLRWPAEFDAPARQLATALSAAAHQADLTALAHVAGLAPHAAARAAQQLSSAGWVRREAGGTLALAGQRRVPASGDAAHRRGVHQRWLAVLRERRPLPLPLARLEWLGRLARHAAGAGKTELAARLAWRATARALREERPDLAAELLGELPVRDEQPPICRGLLALAAGEVHLARARPADAADAFETARDALLESGRPLRSRQAVMRLARAFGDRSRTRDGLELLDALIAEPARLPPRAALLLERGVLLARSGQYERALLAFERSLEAAESGSGDGSGVALRARAARARCLVLLDRLDEAQLELTRAREQASRAAERSVQTTLLLAELQAAAAAGNHRRVVERFEQARGALAARGEADGLGLLYALLADSSVEAGEFERALDAAEESVRWREVHGHRRWLAAAWTRKARIELLLGRLPEARSSARAARRQARQGGASSELCLGRLVSCRVELLAAKHEQARRLAAGALAAARTSGSESDRATALLARAMCLAAEGDTAGSARTAEELLSITQAEGSLRQRGMLLAAGASLVTAPRQAEEVAQQVLGEADAHGDFDLAIDALALAERALLAAGDEDGSARARRDAALRLEATASRLREANDAERFLARPDRALLRERWGERNARRLEALYEIVADLNSLRDPARVAEKLMDHALKVLRAERGALVVAGEQRRLRVMLTRGVEEQTAEDALQLSRTVLDRARGGESVLAIEPATDPRFAEARSVRLFAIRAVLCVPLRTRGRLVGALYVDSRDPVRHFTRDDLRFLEALADHAALALENARAFSRLEDENARLKAELGRADALGEMIGRSEAMQQVFRVLEAAAPSALPVLVLGESGTGKELAARTLHRLGATPEGPFVAVNCAAVPEPIFESTLFGHRKGAFTGADQDRPGLLERADGGTLFLDEIGELPLALQAKLLRVLEDKLVLPLGGSEARQVEFRLISATSRNLEQEAAQSAFRQDLLFRLNVLRVTLPPLRERLEDLPLLIERLLERSRGGFGRLRLDDAVLARFAGWSWPGNVRELDNTLSRLALHADGGVIDEKTLACDPEFAERFRLGVAGAQTQLEEVEARAIRRALELTGGHRVRAARLLGIGRATLFRKIRRYQLEDAGRPGSSRHPSEGQVSG